MESSHIVFTYKHKSPQNSSHRIKKKDLFVVAEFLFKILIKYQLNLVAVK